MIGPICTTQISKSVWVSMSELVLAALALHHYPLLQECENLQYDEDHRGLTWQRIDLDLGDGAVCSVWQYN